MIKKELMKHSRWFSIQAMVVIFCSSVLAQGSGATFEDDFSAGTARWRPYLAAGEWAVADGVLRAVRGGDSARLARVATAADVLIETKVRFLPSSVRRCFGLVLRAQKDGSCIVMRYYDSTDSLELLSYQSGRASHGPRGPNGVNLKPSIWYRMKAAVIDDKFYGKIWPNTAEEPGWQLRTQVQLTRPGSMGLIVHDSTRIEFDEVRIWTEKEQIDELRQIVAREKEERNRKIRESLKMMVLPSPVVRQSAEGPARRVDVVTIANDERYPIDGTIAISFSDTNRKYTVKKSDVVYGVYSFLLPEVSKPTQLKVTFDTSADKKLQALTVLKPVRKRPWREYVMTCLDTLIEHGKDRYGPVHTPMLMSILDVYTLDSPKEPPLLDANVRTEYRPNHGRRSPAGSNLWMDQATIKTMYQCTRLTGDSQYAEAADAYMAYTMEHCRKSNGLLYWGSHSYWNAYKESYGGDGLHEILIKHPDWANMYRINPKAVNKVVEKIWDLHIVDKKTGLHNRHDDGRVGCDFSFVGGEFAMAFSFMYKVTGEQSYLDKAKLVADWHWQHRHPKTLLIPDTPGLTNRYDGRHCMTIDIGPHVAQLLRCYELTGEKHFLEVAITYIKAYEKYGWDEKARTYYGMLKLDGTPVPDRVKGSGYDAWAPHGHVDVWRSDMYSYETPLIAAQSAVYAYELSANDANSRDKELLKVALHWAEVLEKNLPPYTGRRWKKELEAAMPEVKKTGGTYAENYGRAISFFVHLYRATQEKHYLEVAETLATEAVEKLYVNGIFKGHPAKPYYQSNDGVGFLLLALLELDEPKHNFGGAF